MDPFLRKLGIELPIILAPMAGVSTPEMAATVSGAGGLGSIGAGSVDADATGRMIGAARARTERPFLVEFGYGAQWAGQRAPLDRALPAAELIACLRREMDEALQRARKAP